ncbi:tetratricopeptide repeat protein [Amycolatopsis minnesotensis]|uniref:Tetratricopeptide repeat protein n=1 Tax=Amycolatopsis minnesotensis TaxID=337894 RepID=A0ABN2RTF7_9PSEU
MSSTDGHEGQAVDHMPTVLKQLLKKRHLHSYTAFREEYRKAAVEAGIAKANPPAKAQFYRWLKGDVKTIPHSEHCRVLEHLLPGWAADDLFKPDFQKRVSFVPKGAGGVSHSGTSDEFYNDAAFAFVKTPPDLGLVPQEPLDSDSQRNDNEMVVFPATSHSGDVVNVNVPRRTILAGSLGVISGTGFLGENSSINEFSNVPDSNSDEQASSLLDSEVNPVSHFTQMKSVLADNDNLFGPGKIMETVREQIATMQSLRRQWRGEDYHRLVGVQTQFADLLGWLYQDSGKYEEASFWIDRSLQWAHSSREPNTAAFILARRSQLSSDLGDAPEAIDSGEAALAMSRSPRVSAVAATFAAHGYALRGDATESAKLYDLARSQLEHLNTTPEDKYGLFFTAEYLSVYEGHSFAALGEYAKSAEAFQTALRGLPSTFRRDRGVYLAWQALAKAGAADPDTAVEIGTKALWIARETNSSRILHYLRQLNKELEAKWPKANSVKKFTAALTGSSVRK